MTHTYTLTGMTCSSCEAKVKSSLLNLPHVQAVEVSRHAETAVISMGKHIDINTFQNALDSKYSITATETGVEAAQSANWLLTYKPLLIIFAYIAGIAILTGLQGNSFNWMRAMNVFMAGFFLSFSLFKMLDLNGFADSYSSYDIVAKKIRAWGYIYAFLELGLGLAYATNFQPVLTNLVTLLLMSISLIGVLQTVLNKRTIQCACLGTIFNLPMSTVTIIEDSLMIVMSAFMLYQHW